MKKLLSLLLALCIALSLCVPCFAAQNTAQADKLNSLGLFKGTDKGYELDNPLTREQGVVMIIRLLGKEAEAQEKNLAHPFADAKAYTWVGPYLGYAFENGITKGVSDTKFGYGDKMTDAMFLTMLLRVLGYVDKDNGTGDFKWSDPYKLAKTALLSDGTKRDPFLRDDMVLACWNALTAVRKGGGKLSADLIRDGVFTAEAFRAAAGAEDLAAPKMTTLSPSGEIDIVPASLREFITKAEKVYANGDNSKAAKLAEDKFEDIKPVSFKWKCEEPEKFADPSLFSIQLSQTADFAEYRTIPCTKFGRTSGEQAEQVYNLFTDATYYWRVAATLADGSVTYSEPASFTTAAGPRIIFVSGVKNVRDQGGWLTSDGTRMPQGRVYRSRGLESAISVGVKTLMEDLCIRSEIDLRDPNKPQYGAPATSLDKTLINYYNYPGNSYAKFINSPTVSAPSFRVFADPTAYPIIYHCQSGADRTGSIGFILGAIAGVSETDLFIDYEITPDRYVDGTKYTFPEFLTAFRALDGKTTQEKARTFLRTVGLNEMEIHNIEMMMKNDAAVVLSPSDPPKAEGGKVTFTVDPRASGTVTAVKQGGTTLPYTFEDGKLTVTVKSGTTAEATFTDGTKMPLVWK